MGHFFRSMGVVPNVCYPFGVVLSRDYSKGGAVSNRAPPLYFIQCITQCMPVSSKSRKKTSSIYFFFFFWRSNTTNMSPQHPGPLPRELHAVEHWVRVALDQIPVEPVVARVLVAGVAEVLVQLV